MPGQLGLELQGAVRGGVLFGVHGRVLNIRGLAQKAFERNFGVSRRLSLQLSNAGTKLRILQQSTEAGLGGML
jgi:hypothetical protein